MKRERARKREIKETRKRDDTKGKRGDFRKKKGKMIKRRRPGAFESKRQGKKREKK